MTLDGQSRPPRMQGVFPMPGFAPTSFYVVIAGPPEGDTVEYHRFIGTMADRRAQTCFKDMARTYPQCQISRWDYVSFNVYTVTIIEEI